MQTGSTAYGVTAVVLVTVATVLIGAYGLRLSRTTSDFYVASRSVTPLWNASAMGGEYLSAASFLGIAGLVLAYGTDMLWYPVGYTAGYLVLLVLVAAPMRRSGAYTLPDFAESRLESMAVRRTASVLVVLIGWLYLLPQLQGAGLTLRTVTGAPPWVGALIVALVVVFNVVAGGMRSITFVQAFQYWLKLTAISLPLVAMVAVWHAHGAPSPAGAGYPTFPEARTVQVAAATTVTARAPLAVTADGTIDGQPVHGPTVLAAGDHLVGSGTDLSFAAGAEVPHVARIEAAPGDRWALPLSGAGGRGHPLYATYSLMLALFFGTMGLPHVLVRFYTNPDGHAARRTALGVLALLGTYYLFPAAYGALGRLYAQDLLLTGRTDATVLLLPERLVAGVPGELLSALVTAGAFAAFLSTSSGLAVSVGGVISQDVLRGSVRDFRIATVLAVAVPFALTLLVASAAIADIVGLAFAVAASSFCPLLLLGIWWRKLTDAGAIAGLVVGGGLAAVASGVTLGRGTGTATSWSGALLVQPAAWTMPLAFLVMVVVSLRTQHRLPRGVSRAMVRLHTPEALDLDRTPPTLPR